MRAVTLYLVEAYTPPSARPADLASRLGQAIDRATPEGATVRHRRTIHVPSDETSFHLIEAPTADIVRAVAEQAGMVSPRIVDAVELEPPPAY